MIGASRPPSQGVACRLGSFIIKTASSKTVDKQFAENLEAAEAARAAKGSSVEDEVLPLASHAFSAAIDPTVSFHSSDAPSTNTFHPAAFAAGPAHGRPLACRRVS